MEAKTARFNNESQREFQSELRKRVDNYFKKNNISKNGNGQLYLKTVLMFSLYLLPFSLLTFGIVESKLAWIFIAILMGFGMAGIGMNIMHDANHGSYSSNQKFNKVLGYLSIGLVAGYSLNWRIQHNIIHHTFTNVHDHDEDISSIGMLRFEPHQERKGIHRFQFLYAWFFYSLMTLMWSTAKDFLQIVRYNKMGYLKAANTSFGLELSILVSTKILYYAYILLPYFLISEMTFMNWLIGFLIMHATAGLTLAIIFQLAHVTERNEFPLPENGELETNFIEHQLRTTTNFGTNNKLLTFLVGGLNFQVEHHLFPHISHVHYPKIAPIVEATAREYGMPYNSEKTFGKALYQHTKMLYKLGQ
jgi:linoleoyl-CoA desaturase